MVTQTDIVGRVALDWYAVGYVRVSTKYQNEGTQVHQLLAKSMPREQIFVDTAISGTTPARSMRPSAFSYLTAPSYTCSLSFDAFNNSTFAVAIVINKPRIWGQIPARH
jgi:hypothetical protein